LREPPNGGGPFLGEAATTTRGVAFHGGEARLRLQVGELGAILRVELQEQGMDLVPQACYFRERTCPLGHK
jgi:hypothetical protein